MAASKRPRAPRSLKSKDRVYAGIDHHHYGENGHTEMIFIGAPCYGDTAQIHLTKKQLLRLAPWIARAAAWAKAGSL